MTELPTAAICTPLDLEYWALRDLLPRHRFTERTERGTAFAVTELQGRHSDWRLVLTLSGRRNADTAVAAERAIATWRPQVLLLVGIAGGLRGVSIGDVIAASSVYHYEPGQDTDAGRFTRVETLRASHGLSQQAQLIKDEWAGRLGLAPGETPPRVFHRPIAAGSQVVTGSKSDTAALIETHAGDAHGVETEGFGALAAAWPNAGVEAMVIRGVSDLLDDKNPAADQERQPRAARNAAAFALALVERLDPGPGPFLDPPAPGKREPSGPAQTTINYIGAIGDGADITVGAMGPNSNGRVVAGQYRQSPPRASRNDRERIEGDQP
ncbi:5'-methylthioadenosine/S-adenosylhomocysteine nucleosidase [Glycomyces buryatensis]|nr:5'-methylthioadenosine/S-adenosylhomocysteine nucleosidase [Glycomyces buryatensis]